MINFIGFKSIDIIIWMISWIINFNLTFCIVLLKTKIYYGVNNEAL